LIELTHNNFIDDWNKAVIFIEQALKVITNHRKNELSFGVINKNYLPYQPIIPILAILLYHTKDSKDIPSCDSKIKAWYWSSIFKKTYSGSTDTQIAKDLRQMKEWFKVETKIPDVVRDARKILDFNLIEETRPTGAAYRGILSLINLNGAKDFITGKPPEYHDMLNDHHIFPQGQLKNIKDIDRKQDIDCVLNRTLISQDSNLKKEMKKLPKEYLRGIENKIGKKELLKNLKSHFINEKCYDHLLDNNFKEFINEREKTIKKEIRKLIGFDDDDSTDILISPNRPFENRMYLRGILKEGDEYIYWIDKYFNEAGLENLTKSIDSKKIKEIRIITSVDKADEDFKKSFKNFKKSMENKGINCLLKVIVDKKIKSEIHDRFILSKYDAYNIPSSDIIARGQLSEISKSSNKDELLKEFNRIWENSKDIISEWDEICKNR